MKTKLSQGRHGFTLVEIMIVVAIIALLASIAVPGFLRARKRSQASRIINDLRLIDGAVDMYAIENNKATGNTVLVADWTKYMKTGTNLYLTGKDILGNVYGVSDGGHNPEGLIPPPIKRSRTWPPIRSGRLTAKLIRGAPRAGGREQATNADGVCRSASEQVGFEPTTKRLTACTARPLSCSGWSLALGGRR